jgi:hypothetical protein
MLDLSDPAFKYQPWEVRPAGTFLGLPAELRQQILNETLDDDGMNTWDREKYGRHIGNLSCVAPLTRMDMVVVGGTWKRHKMAEEDKLRVMKDTKLAQAKSSRADILRRIQPPSEVRHLLQKQAHVIKTERQKKMRTRDMRCWHCNRRHYSNDPVCPPARGDPQQWENISRSLAYKHPDEFGYTVKIGTKTVFEN